MYVLAVAVAAPACDACDFVDAFCSVLPQQVDGMATLHAWCAVL